MAKRSDEKLYELPDPTEVLGESQPANRVKALLLEAYGLRDAESRLKAIKAELKESLAGSSGVRYNNQCCIVRFQSGKRSLKVDLLIENGVTPEQIEASTKEGEPYYVCELPVIGQGE